MANWFLLQKCITTKDTNKVPSVFCIVIIDMDTIGMKGVAGAKISRIKLVNEEYKLKLYADAIHR